MRLSAEETEWFLAHEEALDAMGEADQSDPLVSATTASLQASDPPPATGGFPGFVKRLFVTRR
jgi:hypothetical protein